MPDALQLLRDDHKRVKDLFKQFEDADDRRAKGAIVDKALTELEIHAEIEEEIFYPVVRRDADAEEDMMDEADEEHHVVKILIAELRKMKPTASHYDAKFTVLAENVKHHIDEEESEMLPKAAELGAERMGALGAQMEQRKLQLMKAGTRRTTVGTGASSNGRAPRRLTAVASKNGRTARTLPKTGRRTTARSGAARATKAAVKKTVKTVRRAAATAKPKPRSAAAARR